MHESFSTWEASTVGNDLRGFAMIYNDGGLGPNASYYNIIISWLADSY
jgi:hypothetical protein